MRSSVILALIVSTLVLWSPRALTEDWLDRWQAHDKTSLDTIDHSNWAQFLQRHIRSGEDGIHRIAYSRVGDHDRDLLGRYLMSLSMVTIQDYRRDEQIAYWINLFNALTVNLILDHYPVASIQRLRGSKPDRGEGPWERKLINIDGVRLSLNDIENRVLRPIAQDQRILYALSCGALGCPNLQLAPFTSDQLDRQLSRAARAYINDKRCISIDGDRLTVSSLYRWNIEDFGGTDEGVIHHLMAYAAPDLAMSLQKFDRIHGDGFDWRLNDIVD